MKKISRTSAIASLGCRGGTYLFRTRFPTLESHCDWGTLKASPGLERCSPCIHPSPSRLFEVGSVQKVIVCPQSVQNFKREPPSPLNLSAVETYTVSLLQPADCRLVRFVEWTSSFKCSTHTRVMRPIRMPEELNFNLRLPHRPPCLDASISRDIIDRHARNLGRSKPTSVGPFRPSRGSSIRTDERTKRGSDGLHMPALPLPTWRELRLARSRHG
jgi:hypothetical protein